MANRTKNPKLEPLRHSTSQPSMGRGHGHEAKDFDTRSPAYESVRQMYDATTDPYCPYTRTTTFKKHMKGRKKLEKLSQSDGGGKMSKSLQREPKPFMTTTMKNMDRPASAPQKEQIPKHQVQNEYGASGGVTISSEPSGNAAEGQAELEVLKAILNREGYLVRLYKTVRTIQRKFKPEIADIIDLVRNATIDVVEAIEKWRNIKVCLS